MRHAAAVCLLLQIAVPAHAFSVSFRPIIDGKEAPAARVCVFPADASTMISQYFRASESRCYSAEDTLALPAGTWNFWAYSGSAVSAWPGSITVTAPGDDVLKRVNVPLRPGVGVRIAPRPVGEHVVFYFPSAGGETMPFAIPAFDMNAPIVLPVERPVVPVLMRRGELVRVGAARIFRAGTEPYVEFAPRSRSTVDFVAEWRTDRGKLREVLSLASTAPPPQIVLRTGGGTEIAPLVPTKISDADLVFFTDVPREPERLTLILRGAVWQHDEISTEVDPETSVVIPAEPLRTEPASQIRIDWSIGGIDPSRLTMPTCAGGTAAVPLKISLLRCDEAPPGLSSDEIAGRCRSISESDADAVAGRGAVELSGVPAGQYVTEVRLGSDRPLRHSAEARLLKTSVVPVSIEVATVQGTVKRDEEPIAAELRFGLIETTSSAGTGAYTLFVTRDLDIRPINIVACDEEGRYVNVPEEKIERGEWYDIKLTSKPFQLTVLDSITRRPISGATTTASILHPDVPEATMVTVRGAPSDDAGISIIEGVQPEQWISLCAKHERYRDGCIRIQADAMRGSLVLIPAEASRGIISGVSGMVGGRFYWVRADGVVAERGAISEDGTFAFHGVHDPPEYLVVVSRSHPLFVVANWQVIDGTVTAAIPSTPHQSLRIALPRSASPSTASVALLVGGRLIPQAAFTFHQISRGQQPVVTAGSRIEVPAIAATGLINVLRGVEPDSPLVAQLPTGTDPFTLPHLRAHMPVFAIGPDGLVQLE